MINTSNSENVEKEKSEEKEEKEKILIECLIRELFLSRKPKKITIIIEYE